MHQFVVSFTSHGGKGPPRLLENTGVHLAWIPYCSMKLYMYIINSEVEGSSVILGKVDPKNFYESLQYWVHS